MVVGTDFEEDIKATSQLGGQHRRSGRERVGS